VTEQETCEQRIGAALESTMDDIRILWTTYTIGEKAFESVKELYDKYEYFCAKEVPSNKDDREEYDDEKDDLESDIEILDDDERYVFDNYRQASDLGGPEGIYDYGLSFDYVPYDDQNSYGDFFRWQLSWGGPSDELQFYVTPDNHVKSVDYAYKDWLDGATRTLKGDNKKMAVQIFDWFAETGTVDHVREEALANE